MGIKIFDKLSLRNYTLFFVGLVFVSSILIYTLISGNEDIEKLNQRVNHTYEVISKLERLSRLIESSLAAQRAYIITNKNTFEADYNHITIEVNENLAAIISLTSDNPLQMARLNKVKYYLDKLFQETNLQSIPKATNYSSNITLANIKTINTLKNNITRISQAVLKAEYGLLSSRINAVAKQKSRYFITLLLGMVITLGLLMVLNGFILNSQSRRHQTELNLKNTEQRLALALEGTQDGIFDYDIINNSIFYSKRMFGMLGYDNKAHLGNLEDYTKLIHPDDIERVMAQVTAFITGEISNYNVSFRIQHLQGHWIWIRSIAQLINNSWGKPIRMIGGNADITLIKENEQRLEQEKDAAQAANLAKTDFLAHMSHEIRTPLTAILGISEIFNANFNSFEYKYQKLMQTLGASAVALRDLIDDILDFSKIESGEIDLAQELFYTNTLFESIISIVSLKAQEKNIDFNLDYSNIDNRFFKGDVSRIKQILINLIGNAIKFTHNGSVKIHAYRLTANEQSFLYIDITDTGLGISPEKFEVIFERFKQADSSVSRRFGGTGLGLPISKKLAKLMGGDILVKSEKGKGSTFTVILPDEENLLAEAHNKGAIIPETYDAFENFKLPPNKSILVVEDYESNITFLKFILDELGCNYKIARNGEEGVKQFYNNPKSFNLVLMDIQMPIMDGFTAANNIRAYEREKNLARTPIVAMTAHALAADKQATLNKTNIDFYLSKPLSVKLLKRTIIEYIT